MQCGCNMGTSKEWMEGAPTQPPTPPPAAAEAGLVHHGHHAGGAVLLMYCWCTDVLLMYCCAAVLFQQLPTHPPIPHVSSSPTHWPWWWCLRAVLPEALAPPHPTPLPHLPPPPTLTRWCLCSSTWWSGACPSTNPSSPPSPHVSLHGPVFCCLFGVACCHWMSLPGRLRRFLLRRLLHT